MAANKDNITKRSDTETPLTFDQADKNLQELENVIDDQKEFANAQTEINSRVDERLSVQEQNNQESNEDLSNRITELRQYSDQTFEVAIKHNLSAQEAPSATNDSTEGYQVRSLWFDQANSNVWRCLNATEGNAIWVDTTLSIEELGSAATVNIDYLLDRKNQTGFQSSSTISDPENFLASSFEQLSSVKSLNPELIPDGSSITITNGPKAGTFTKKSGDFSDNLTNDPLNGIYVTFESDPSGDSYILVRQYSLWNALVPEWWGAIGDGTTDDGESIQACIDYAKIMKMHVELGPKTYNFNRTLVVEGQSRTLFGQGFNKTTLVNKTASVILRVLESSYCDIKGFKIEGSPTSTSQVGVAVPIRSDVAVALNNRISDIWAVNLGTGFYLQNPVHTSLTNCRTDKSVKSRGLYSEFVTGKGAGQGGTNLNCISCWFQCAQTNSSKAVRLEGALAPTFHGCQFENSGIGVELVSCTNSTFTSCLFEDNAFHIVLERCNSVFLITPYFDFGTSLNINASIQNAISINGGKNITIQHSRCIDEDKDYINYFIRFINNPSNVRIIDCEYIKPLLGSNNVANLIIEKDGIIQYNSMKIQNARLQPQIYSTAPTNPSFGEQFIADGQNWNPTGDGRSIVVYIGQGAWKLITTI